MCTYSIRHDKLKIPLYCHTQCPLIQSLYPLKTVVVASVVASSSVIYLLVFHRHGTLQDLNNKVTPLAVDSLLRGVFYTENFPTIVYKTSPWWTPLFQIED